MIEVKENVILAPYTMYKIGGGANFFIEVTNAQELKEALMFSLDKKLPFFILGAGSNTLISDGGFKGVVIRNKDGSVKADGELLHIEAGAMMSKAVLESAKAGLTGFEWGIGVPGTVGGSVRGNAGCFGGEMGQIVKQVRLFEFPISNFQFPNKFQNSNFKIRTIDLDNKQCKFSYRDSIFKKNPEWVILSITLKLKKGDAEQIREKIKSTTLDRSAKQDIGTKSCGCIFKNIEWSETGTDKDVLLQRFPELSIFTNRTNIPASFLLDKAGLKNRRVGHAFISPKHANFFVNEGGASAVEVKQLIEIAKKEVWDKFGLALQEEIKYLGF